MKRSRWFALIALVLSAQCGGSSSGPTPSTPARGTLVVTDLTVSGAKTSTGYVYTIRVTARNTGNAVANISNTTLEFAAGGITHGTLSMTDAFLSTAMTASSTQVSRTIHATDDVAGNPYADMVTVTVSYSGGIGTETAIKSAQVPPLPTPPPPSPATASR
jgi:hypothetical protein